MMRRVAAGFVAVVAVFVSSAPVYAQEALSVSITPPLFQLTIGPGESWSSVVKVVNNNTYDVTYSAQVVDFEAQGETGLGKFIPLIESFAEEPKRTDSLGSWIELSKDPITIAAGKSGDVQFTVHVPENADPGGHYAAIMVGPNSEGSAAEGSNMRISSFVTSLLFVRIKGEVIESGRIREFTTTQSLYQTPQADFALRFENTGNTHLRPSGLITLYNMWGKKRGEVLINEKSNFGNVLPRSIRKFEFSWNGENNPFDIGRYSAVVTLAYGDDEKQNTTATTYFWVVPVVPVAITLGVILFIVVTMMWMVRRYIRRALSIEAMHHPRQAEPAAQAAPEQLSTIRALVQPIKEGVVDLRNVGARAESRAAVAEHADSAHEVEYLSVGGFIAKYKLFFVFVALILAIVIGAWLFLSSVLVSERAYEITELTGTDVASSTIR